MMMMTMMAACCVSPCRIFNISNGKQKKLYKGSQGEDGTLIKVRKVWVP